MAGRRVFLFRWERNSNCDLAKWYNRTWSLHMMTHGYDHKLWKFSFEFVRNLTCFTGIFKFNGFNMHEFSPLPMEIIINFAAKNPRIVSPAIRGWSTSQDSLSISSKWEEFSKNNSLEVMMVDTPLIRPYVLGECEAFGTVVPLDSHDWLKV